MSDFQLRTSVAFFIFNRPETTEKVFSEIAKAKPPKLLVVADGSRPDVKGEKKRCATARKVIDKIDWECEVLTNYADQNMGCRDRLSSGLDWVFEQVEEAIILEDDCLPHSTFFRFCEELLEKYRDDNRVMHIGGINFQFGKNVTPFSYYFSNYVHVWGWASWRRAWKNYDSDMKIWGKMKASGWLEDLLPDKKELRYWTSIFDKTCKGKINTWDYQWMFACWLKNGLSVVPNTNLVSNIGFGDNATHTKEVCRLSNMLVEAMTFPLVHSDYVSRNVHADNLTFVSAIHSGSVLGLIKYGMQKIYNTVKYLFVK